MKKNWGRISKPEVMGGEEYQTVGNNIHPCFDLGRTACKNRYYTLILFEQRIRTDIHFDLGRETIPYYFLEI